MTDFINKVSDSEIEILGEITKETVSAVLQASLPLIQSASELTIDLGKVERTDSAGLALCFEWMACAHSRNYQVKFRNLPHQLLAIARASEMDSLIPLK